MALSAAQRVSGQTTPQVSETPPVSMTAVVRLFFTTLFEPITSPKTREFFQKQFSNWKDDVRTLGVRGYVNREVTERPLVVMSRVSLLCGIGNVFGENGQLVASLFRTATVFVQQGATLKSMADAVDAAPELDQQVAVVASTKYDLVARKAMKITLYGGMVYLAASFPAAAAAEWNTLADVRAHYSGGPCAAETFDKLMGPAKQCIKGGSGSLQECRALVPSNVPSEITVFARHVSKNPELDPVSVTRLDGGRVCVFTALDSTSGVTKLCFPDPANPNNRTIARVDVMPLAKAHEGLASGTTEVVLEVGPVVDSGKSCASFISVKPDYTTPPEVCVLTALEKGGKVSQVCLNPKNPIAMTLKARPEVQLPDQDGPTAIVINNPKALGLDVRPETLEAPCVESEGVSWWDALGAWWNQKWPCAKPETPLKKEL